MSLSPLLSRYQNVILDLDGTVWLGDSATPGAPEAIAAIRAAGKGLMFITNDGLKSPEEYVRKLWSLGCTASPSEVVSVGAALQYVLAGRPAGRGAYVIGSEAIFQHVADSGHRILNHSEDAHQADVVVVVAHEDFAYPELRTAIRAVANGAEIYSGGRDRNYPTPSGIAPGTGSVLAAVEYATQRTAYSVGKPNPQVFEVALDRLGPGDTLVIGDNLASDLAGAAAAGLDAAVVLTGSATRAAAEAAENPTPVAIAEDLASLVMS
ncbi:MAG: HAD-IIA family hydrolase [Solirubrobacterales bacterium]|nr:HAD-IIA family hydrolase [Solirubrobacterales bacterium]